MSLCTQYTIKFIKQIKIRFGYKLVCCQILSKKINIHRKYMLPLIIKTNKEESHKNKNKINKRKNSNTFCTQESRQTLTGLVTCGYHVSCPFQYFMCSLGTVSIQKCSKGNITSSVKHVPQVKLSTAYYQVNSQTRDLIKCLLVSRSHDFILYGFLHISSRKGRVVRFCVILL